jgi:hypothetical protein
MRSAFDDLIGRRGYQAAMLVGTAYRSSAGSIAGAREILQAAVVSSSVRRMMAATI